LANAVDAQNLTSQRDWRKSGSETKLLPNNAPRNNAERCDPRSTESDSQTSYVPVPTLETLPSVLFLETPALSWCLFRLPRFDSRRKSRNPGLDSAAVMGGPFPVPRRVAASLYSFRSHAVTASNTSVSVLDVCSLTGGASSSVARSQNSTQIRLSSSMEISMALSFSRRKTNEATPSPRKLV
jgi:hypothetical protein